MRTVHSVAVVELRPGGVAAGRPAEADLGQAADLAIGLGRPPRGWLRLALIVVPAVGGWRLGDGGWRLGGGGPALWVADGRPT